jgi:hypothetical protein
MSNVWRSIPRKGNDLPCQNDSAAVCMGLSDGSQSPRERSDLSKMVVVMLGHKEEQIDH